MKHKYVFYIFHFNYGAEFIIFIIRDFEKVSSNKEIKLFLLEMDKVLKYLCFFFFLMCLQNIYYMHLMEILIKSESI